MKIHHYTTIETLALILKYRNIRFNKLENVDDLEESEYGFSSENIKLGKYIFVSCWTRDPIENISLWGLYTKYKGVRISLNEDMLITYPLVGKFKCYFDEPIIVRDDYMINGVSNVPELFDVVYVDNLEEQIYEIGKLENSILSFSNDFGIFKRKQWKFQQESRFIIRVMPIKQPDSFPPKNYCQDITYLTKIMDSMYQSLIDNQSVSVNFFDRPMNDHSFESMEILLAPQTSEAERIIVESLINKYCPTATLKESVFMGKIRGKGSY